MQIPRARSLLLCLFAILAVILGFYSLEGRTALAVFKYSGYGLTLISLIIFAFAWVSSWDVARVRSALRAKGWMIAAIIGLLSLFVHAQERHGFKIVMDEVVLASTAKRMHETREATLTYRGFQFGNDFITLEADPDKRPLLYPVLVSLLHDFTGYRIENSFILNGLLTPFFLGLLFLVCRRVAGNEAGIAAMLIFATIPLFTQTAAGGGFELLNLTMILLTIHLGMNYATKPSDQTLTAFCLSGVLLAQTRYESVIFVFPVAIIIAWVWWRTRQVSIPWPLIFAPLLLVGYPLQQKIMQINPILWQLSDRPSDHGAFSIFYLYDNLGRALNYFLSFDGSLGNSHVVFILGVAGCAFFWLKLYKQRREVYESPDQSVFVIFTLFLFVLSGLLLCYFWGAFDDILTARLSLPVQLLMVLSFAWVWGELAAHRRRWRPIIAICLAYLFLWTAPRLQNRSYASINVAAEEVNWLRGFIEEAPPNSFVFDSSSPLLWATGHISANSLDGLHERMDGFIYHYNKGTFDNYFVVQRLGIDDFSKDTWTPKHPLQATPPGITVEPVKKIIFNPLHMVRISRIASIDEEKLRGWAEAEKLKRKAEDDAAIPSSTSAAVDASIAKEKEIYLNRWMENLP